MNASHREGRRRPKVTRDERLPRRKGLEELRRCRPPVVEELGAHAPAVSAACARPDINLRRDVALCLTSPGWYVKGVSIDDRGRRAVVNVRDHLGLDVRQGQECPERRQGRPEADRQPCIRHGGRPWRKPAGGLPCGLRRRWTV